jgi:hypothetical protein
LVLVFGLLYSNGLLMGIAMESLCLIALAV